ncbi:hypothetical protein [Paracidobacterium acidisoli]|uniref:hypothetical protein n=1 Tax=Paracidobacterium acidisoli TaxID=2303751 RepID=UPI001314F4BF|nr:hypothetical protein [Paracidobacterium acidisoli]MBT9331588.1 hypothetical protein [Paracidobacterium acidisoli]
MAATPSEPGLTFERWSFAVAADFLMILATSAPHANLKKEPGSESLRDFCDR